MLSAPAITDRRAAASLTVWAMGPTVSWFLEMGITRWRDVKPTVGLMPTYNPRLAGAMMLPCVSVARVAKASPAAAAIPEPLEELYGS